MNDDVLYVQPAEACRRFGVKRAVMMRLAETSGAIRRLTKRLYLINVGVVQDFIENGGCIKDFSRKK